MFGLEDELLTKNTTHREAVVAEAGVLPIHVAIAEVKDGGGLNKTADKST